MWELVWCVHKALSDRHSMNIGRLPLLGDSQPRSVSVTRSSDQGVSIFFPHQSLGEDVEPSDTREAAIARR